MRKLFLSVFIFCSILVTAQEAAVIKWLDTNAISIEDASQNTPLTAFAQNTPQKFKDARIFGFGEATHNTKEFFDLKAKFFKYLVEKQGVNIFIMEDAFITSYRVNEWLAGRAQGDARKMAGNLGFLIWRTEELANLLQWMKDYNSGKPKEEQIRFYGMDDQFGVGINTIVRQYVKDKDLSVKEELLVVADSCANKIMMPAPKKEWSAANVAKLKELRDILDKQITAGADEIKKQETLHALDVLIQYTNFIGSPNQKLRDNDMFDNVKWIMEHECENSKAFVWAHNDHINKRELGALGLPSVGSRLKEFYKETYYSVGFDFGKGKLYGLTYTGKERKPQAVAYDLEKPYSGTYAEILAKAQPEIFFIDMTDAVKDAAMAKFLSSNKKQLSAGGGGYHPKDRYVKKRNYSETYDGVLFVENVSIPNYIKERVQESYLIK